MKDGGNMESHSNLLVVDANSHRDLGKTGLGTRLKAHGTICHSAGGEIQSRAG